MCRCCRLSIIMMYGRLCVLLCVLLCVVITNKCFFIAYYVLLAAHFLLHLFPAPDPFPSSSFPHTHAFAINSTPIPYTHRHYCYFKSNWVGKLVFGATTFRGIFWSSGDIYSMIESSEFDKWVFFNFNYFNRPKSTFDVMRELLYVHRFMFGCIYVCICMYVRFHVRTYVCMYVCMYVCTGVIVEQVK